MAQTLWTYQKAWDLGNRIGRDGGIPASFPALNNDLLLAYLAGTRAFPLRQVIGWRYGPLPALGYSTNYRDQVAEQGVSLMALGEPDDGDDATDGTFALFNSGRPIHRIRGYLSPFRGSDGEPLVFAAVDLGVWAQKEKQEAMTHSGPVFRQLILELAAGDPVRATPTTAKWLADERLSGRVREVADFAGESFIRLPSGKWWRESDFELDEGVDDAIRHYEVTRRGTCCCNFDPRYQCGGEGQSVFTWEISAHIHSLDTHSFAIDNGELLKIANQYDTEEMWATDSCEAVCNGWLAALIRRCQELKYDLIAATAQITPNQFVDVRAVWEKGDPVPNPVPTPTGRFRKVENLLSRFLNSTPLQ